MLQLALRFGRDGLKAAEDGDQGLAIDRLWSAPASASPRIVSGLTRTARRFSPVNSAPAREFAAKAVSRTALGFAPQRGDGFRFDIGALYPESGRRQRLRQCRSPAFS